MTAAAASQGDADVARVAALLGDPSRARMLIARHIIVSSAM